jgi:hypothetical protein
VAINAADYVPPTKRRPDLPVTIDAFIARLLARNPEDRFQSAKEISHGMVLAAEGRSPDASGPRHSLSGEETSDLRGFARDELFGNTLSEAKTTPKLSIDPPTTVLAENQVPVFARTHGVPNRGAPLKRSWLVGGVLAGVALFLLIVFTISALRASPEGTVEAVGPGPTADQPANATSAPPPATTVAPTIPVEPVAEPVVDQAPDAAPATSVTKPKAKTGSVPKAVPVPSTKKRKDRGF